MNEDGILYYLFLFFVNLGIFASLTTLMVLKGWIPYPSGESKSDPEQISQQSSETTSTDVVSPPNGKSRTSGTRRHTPKSPLKREVDAESISQSPPFANNNITTNKLSINEECPIISMNYLKQTTDVHRRERIPKTTR